MRVILVGVAAFALGLLVGGMLFPGGDPDPAVNGSDAARPPAPDAGGPPPGESWDDLPPDDPASRDFSQAAIASSSPGSSASRISPCG